MRHFMFMNFSIPMSAPKPAYLSSKRPWLMHLILSAAGEAHIKKTAPPSQAIHSGYSQDSGVTSVMQ